MKRVRNKWLARISETVGEQDGAKAIEQLVLKYKTPEQSLESLSKHLGVKEIERVPLPFEGGVYEIAGARYIKLNSLAIPVRQSFSLAHELAHLILERTFETSVSCTEDEPLERACDEIAADLLMPSIQIHKLSAGLGMQSPEKLSAIANHFGVSLQAAAKRLRDLGLWKLGIGMWKYDSDAREIWFVGNRPWRTTSPSFSVFQLAIEAGEPVCTREYFPNDHDTELVELKAHHIGKNFVVAIVALPK